MQFPVILCTVPDISDVTVLKSLFCAFGNTSLSLWGQGSGGGGWQDGEKKEVKDEMSKMSLLVQHITKLLSTPGQEQRTRGTGILLRVSWHGRGNC